MNHESENTPLIQEEFPQKQQPIPQLEKPKVVSVNQLFLQNAGQAFNPGKMITKQFYVFSQSIKKSIDQYRNNGNIDFTQNITTSLEEVDRVSYNSNIIKQDQSITSKGIQLLGKSIIKIKDTINGKQQPQQQQENQQQQIKNETHILDQNQQKLQNQEII